MEKLKLSESKTNFTKELEHPIFALVAKVAKRMQIPAYTVGGYVRDLILNRPSKDIDFVVVGSGIEFAQEVGKEGGNLKVSYFKNFGTAMLKYKGIEVEFVGARKESYQRNSRKPIVEEGTLSDDQNRRDFTINAMAISLNETNFGELIDPFDGLVDLDKKLIQTPLDPDITYSDDPLRMMRAIRFATQLGYRIEDKSFDSISKNAHRIEIISAERITSELNKIILSPTPSIGFKLLFNSGLLKLIFPLMVDLHGVETKNGISHKDNFYHTIQVLDNVASKSDDLWIRWAAILHDIAKPPTKRFEPDHGWTFHGHEDKGARMVPKIFKSLRLPLDAKMKFVQKLVALHLRPIALTKNEITDSALRRLLFEAGEDIDALMILCQSDITTANKQKLERYLAKFEVVREKLKEVEERDKIRNWQPPIPGETIMEYYGIRPCREVGIIKNAIKDAILDGDILNDYDAAYSLMLQKGNELGLVKGEKNEDI